MDAIRLGLSLRALRIRRGLRQFDVAKMAGVSRSTISAIERGEIGHVAVATLQRVAEVLGARLEISVRWRGEQLDRLLDASHAAIVERVIRLLQEYGWETAVEVSFAIGGERGSIDVLGRGPGAALVVAEIKSVIPDSQAMLHTLDRKGRLAPRIAAERGWRVSGPIGRVLVVADTPTARRRIAALSATYATAFPDRGPAVRRWLRDPHGAMSGILFLPYASPGSIRSSHAGIQRVRGPRRAAFRGPTPPFDDKGGE